MPAPQNQEADKFFQERAKAIVDHVNGNPELVKALLKAHAEPKASRVRATEFFEELDAGNI